MTAAIYIEQPNTMKTLNDKLRPITNANYRAKFATPEPYAANHPFLLFTDSKKGRKHAPALALTVSPAVSLFE